MISILLTTILTAASLNNIEIEIYDELTPLFPDSKLESNKTTFQCDSPRNTYAAVHLLINGADPDIPLTLSSNIDGNWYKLITVPVEENTGKKKSYRTI